MKPRKHRRQQQIVRRLRGEVRAYAAELAATKQDVHAFISRIKEQRETIKEQEQRITRLELCSTFNGVQS